MIRRKGDPSDLNMWIDPIWLQPWLVMHSFESEHLETLHDVAQTAIAHSQLWLLVALVITAFVFGKYCNKFGTRGNDMAYHMLKRPGGYITLGITVYKCLGMMTINVHVVLDLMAQQFDYVI